MTGAMKVRTKDKPAFIGPLLKEDYKFTVA